MSANNFETERHAMVDRHIEGRGISNPRVLEAMRTVPRHLFLPERLQKEAYRDHPILIGCRQTISQPYMVALMTALLDPQPHDRVLEIGTGSGYQTAVLAALAREVVSVERHAPLAESARDTLNQLGFHNVTIHVGDGTLGWPETGPYDAALFTAGAPSVPEPVKQQLAPEGRLVIPVGTRTQQRLIKLVRDGDDFRAADSVPCVFVPLVGEKGWQTEA